MRQALRPQNTSRGVRTGNLKAVTSHLITGNDTKEKNTKARKSDDFTQ